MFIVAAHANVTTWIVLQSWLSHTLKHITFTVHTVSNMTGELTCYDRLSSGLQMQRIYFCIEEENNLFIMIQIQVFLNQTLWTCSQCRHMCISACCLPYTLYKPHSFTQHIFSLLSHSPEHSLSVNNQLRSMFDATGRVAPFWWKMS